MQKKIVLTPEVIESINFLYKICEMYFGVVNAANTYQPKIDVINRSVVDDEVKKEEPQA